MCAVLDERPNKNAASNKNGTVGKIGRNIPINPAITLKAPRISQTILII